MPLAEKLRSFITRVKGRGGGEAKIERDVLNVKMGIDFFEWIFNIFYEWNKMKGLCIWDSETWKGMPYEKTWRIAGMRTLHTKAVLY